MKKFIILYYSPAGAMQKMQTSAPDIMQAEMDKWMAWFKGLGDKVVDMGEMLAGSASLTSEGWGDTGADSPTGYSIIQADDLAAAKELVADHPHIGWFEGCRVDVFEQVVMPENA